MDISVLEDVGLTSGEVKVYLASLELGASKTGHIIEKTGMASSAVHNAIHGLLEKGALSTIMKDKTHLFQAAQPSQLLAILEEKKRRLEMILPELSSRQNILAEQQHAEVFIGTKGIMVMLNKLIADAKQKQDYSFFASHTLIHDDEIQEFFSRFDMKRSEKCLRIRGIAKTALEPLFRDRKTMQVKYTTKPILSDVSLCNKKTAFIAWGNKPRGYLIHSKEMNLMFTDFFEKTWEIL